MRNCLITIVILPISYLDPFFIRRRRCLLLNTVCQLPGSDMTPRRTAICPESPLQLLRSGGIESPRSSPFLTLNCRIYLNFTYTSTSVADWCVSLSLSVLVYELGTRIDGGRRPLEVSWSLNRLYDPFLTLRYLRKLENAAITMWESAFVPTQPRAELFTTFFIYLIGV